MRSGSGTLPAAFAIMPNPAYARNVKPTPPMTPGKPALTVATGCACPMLIAPAIMSEDKQLEANEHYFGLPDHPCAEDVEQSQDNHEPGREDVEALRHRRDRRHHWPR